MHYDNMQKKKYLCSILNQCLDQQVILLNLVIENTKDVL